MNDYLTNIENADQLRSFLGGKTEHTVALFHHFLNEYQKLGEVLLYPTKTMIGVGIADKRVAWITQLGKNFIHVVFPFTEPHPDNLCFTKIAQVPGDSRQFNHHFRMYRTEDINEEVLQFMELALRQRY